MRDHCEALHELAVGRGLDRARVEGNVVDYRATIASRGLAGTAERQRREIRLTAFKAGHQSTAVIDDFGDDSLARAADDAVAAVEMSIRIHGERTDDVTSHQHVAAANFAAADLGAPMTKTSALSALRRIEARDSIAFGEVVSAVRTISTVAVDEAGTRASESSAAGLRIRAAASRDYSFYVRSGAGGPLGRWSLTATPWLDLDRVEGDANLVGEEAVVLASSPVTSDSTGSVALEPALASLALLSLARRRFSVGATGAGSELLSVASTSPDRTNIEQSSRFVAAAGDSMVVRAGLPDASADSGGALIWMAPVGAAPLPTTGLAVFGLAGATMLDDGSVDLVTELAWTVVNGALDQPLRGVRLRLDAGWVFRVASTADIGPDSAIALPERGTSALDASFRTIRAPAVVIDGLSWSPIDSRGR